MHLDAHKDERLEFSLVQQGKNLRRRRCEERLFDVEVEPSEALSMRSSLTKG